MTAGAATFGADSRTLTVRLPITLRKRGGRKAIVTPDGSSAWAPQRTGVDRTLVKALARAFRWRNLLETGVYGTVAEVASAEKINPSYVSRLLRLTLLAPQIVEAILKGAQPVAMTLAAAMQPFPTGWEEQRRGFSIGESGAAPIDAPYGQQSAMTARSIA